jgi:hypothetical protein
MKNFCKKHKISIAISSFLFIIMPLFYYGALFGIKKIQNNANLIQERTTDNNLEKLKLEKIPKMDETNAEFEKNKEAVGTILSSNSKVDFIKYIEALAGETNNKIEIKVLDDNQNKTVTKKVTKTTAKDNDNEEKKNKSLEEQLTYKQYISMQLELTGDYQSFLNFVQKLENNKYYVNVISFNLQKELIGKDGSLMKGNATSSGTIFLSPTSTSAVQNNPETAIKEEQQTLKSSLNIIVYIE